MAPDANAEAQAPPRPTSWDPDELGFERQGMVRWLSPRFLLGAGREVVVSKLFAQFADKREVEAGLPQDPIPENPLPANAPPAGPGGALCYAGEKFRDDEGALWFDFACDVGEGFDPTYTIAWLLAQKKLDLEWEGESHHTKRGKLLVLGGDQVYPSASWPAYKDRFRGPYKAALPFVWPEDGPPDMYAIPGNHDWYDGLTSFMRLFCQGTWIGGWRTRQRRSYFALQLSESWWLWATDIQFDVYMDGPQLEYFRRKGKELGEGDNVILATAKPSWVGADRDYQRGAKPGESWETLNFVEEELIAKKARVAVTITGDKHHYARYTRQTSTDDRPGVPQERITAGGGGAHTSATHDLAPSITLPQLVSEGTSTYDSRGISPTPDESLDMRRAGLLRISREHALGGVIGLIYALIGLALALAEGSVPWSIVVVLVVAGLLGFGLSKFAESPLLGGLHTAAHVIPAVGLALLGLSLWPAWVVALGLAVYGWSFGRVVLALYLLTANKSDAAKHTTEIYGGLASTQHKNFLRFRLDRDGSLTIYPIGVSKCPKWDLAGEGAEETDPWFTKPDDVKPERLIEAPFTVDPGDAGEAASAT